MAQVTYPPGSESLRYEHCVADRATVAEGPRREDGTGLMPELYINGAWATASAGGRRTIRCPADGSLVAEIDEATADDARAAVAAAYDAFHHGPWPTTSAARTGRPAAPRRRPARARRRRGRAGRVQGHRQATGREPVRRRRRGLGVPPLRQHRGRERRPHRRHRPRGRAEPGRPRAARRLRADRALELPAAAGVVEGRALPRGRQHLRAQAQRAHAAHQHHLDAAARGGRAARRASATSSWGPGRTPRRR